jgi:hypothetical protein
MKTQYVFLAFLTSIFLATCTVESNHPGFTITTSNQEDAVSITSEEGISLIDINSPSGVGSAHFELVSGILPEKIITRLHLKGLEEFRLSYNETVISASISSGSAFNISSQNILLSNIEYPIQAGHPLWLEIKVVSDQTIKKIPLEEGYFEITFPKESNKKIGSSFEIQWVDFYR